jgi:hypothetical protein
MRKPAVAAAIVVLGAIAAGVVLWREERGTPRNPSPVPPQVAAGRGASGPLAPAAPTPISMQFAREGEAGKIAEAVERVARPGRAQVAVTPCGDGRWVCILADAKERFCELDAGMVWETFPGLQEAGFRPLPPPISRTTASIYRSVAKRAMGYDGERGDRIIILLCPREEWPKLSLRWPSPAASRKGAKTSENP